MSGGLRHDKDKTRVDLIAAIPMMKWAAVFTAGLKKYPDHNWTKGMKWSKCIASFLRHFFKWLSPIHTDIDKETGLPHLWLAFWNIGALVQYETTHPELDDRVKAKDIGWDKPLLDGNDMIEEFLEMLNVKTPIPNSEHPLEKLPVINMAALDMREARGDAYTIIVEDGFTIARFRDGKRYKVI